MATKELSSTTVVTDNLENTEDKAPETGNKPEQFQIPNMLERYELKYTIPFSMIEPMEQFIKPYCSYDNYSTLSTKTDNFYKVNSLYFDTPEFLFLRKRMMKEENRFNMRIRSYGDEPVAPYFLEIKQRRSDTVRKFRAKCDDIFLKELGNIQLKPSHFSTSEKEYKNQELFYNTLQTYHANPVVLVQYMRKAFISDVDDYARVTFDRSLRYMPQNAFNVHPYETNMIPCDNETNFDAGCSIILELKCFTSYVPMWMIDLVRVFQLNRRGFSKYSNCIKPVFDRYSCGDIFSRNPNRHFN